MGDKSLGTAHPHTYRLVSDMGVRNRRPCFLDRPCHLGGLYRQARGISRNYCLARRDRGNSGGGQKTLARRRLFHWIMAAAMLTLLFTAFAPKVGYQFPWVTYHWIAGLVLIASIIFHVIHATFFMDFWSIWPDKMDIEDAKNRARRMMGGSAPRPHRFAKYPFENKMYHLTIVLAGLSVAITGGFMIFRVRTPFLTRNPYLFSDMTWGMMYVLHGLAGVGLIALIMAHIYFALRPEKLAITRGMIVGSITREHFLEEHDPQRWKVVSKSASSAHPAGSSAD
jgi:cytochrome b subunit of formate dehydrogenase